MSEEPMQIRAEPGAQVRDRVHADVTAVLSAARLPGHERAAILEDLGAAVAADGRESLGGARLLLQRRDIFAGFPQIPACGRRADVLAGLATAFVHPSGRR
jgi:hypothetical protein